MESSAQPGLVQPPTGTDNSGVSVKGLYLVFTSPAEFYTKLKERHHVLVPYLVYVILTIAMFYLLMDLMGPVIYQSTIDKYADNPQMQEAMRGMSVDRFKWSFLIFGGLTYLLMPVVAAALALFFGNFVFSGKAKYGQVFSVVTYATLIYMAGNVLSAVMARITNNPMFSFSPAILAADRGFDSPLFLFLSKINPFLIWELIAAGIGLAILYNFPRNKGTWVSVLSLGLMSAIQVIWTAIASLIR